MSVAKFEVGQIYQTRLVTDWESVLSLVVVRRTAKTIWVSSQVRSELPLDWRTCERHRVSVHDDRTEQIRVGRYAWAPVFFAESPRVA